MARRTIFLALHAMPGGTRGRAAIGHFLWLAFAGRDLLYFLAFGGIAALANLATGWLLYGAGISPELPYWLATGVAAGTGLVVNFALNYSFNFKFRERSALQQFRTFCVIAGFGIILTSGFASALLPLMGRALGSGLAIGGIEIRPDFAAHFVAVGLVVIYSFPAHRLISFNVGVRARLQQLGISLAGAK